MRRTKPSIAEKLQATEKWRGRVLANADVATARLEAGFTQVQLADVLDVHVQTVKRWERFEGLTPGVLVRIEKALGVRVELAEKSTE